MPRCRVVSRNFHCDWHVFRLHLCLLVIDMWGMKDLKRLVSIRIHLLRLVSMSINKTSKQCLTTFDEAKSPEIWKRLSCCHHQGPIGVDQGSPSVHLMAKYLWFHIIQAVNMGERGRLRAKRPLNLTVQYAVIWCWSVLYIHRFVIYLIWTLVPTSTMQTGQLILTIKSIGKMQIQ